MGSRHSVTYIKYNDSTYSIYFYLISIIFLDGVDGLAQNQGPDKTQDDLAIAIDHVFGSNVRHLDAATADVIE